jgi:Ca-activated chloride channel family protein
MRRSVLIIFLFFILAPTILAADYKDLNEKGVKAFKREAYDSSLQYFQQALEENPENNAIDFNLGNAFHQQGMYQDALQSYETAARAADSSLSAESFYNIGNTHYRAGELDKAAEAYKKSLSYAPDDKDTKYNLELTLKKLEEQQQQQQNQCDQDNKDQDQKDQDKKDQEKQEQDKQDQNQEQKQDQEEQQDQQQKEQDQQEQKQEQDQQKQDQEQDKQEQQQEQEQQQQKDDQGQEQDQDSQQTPQGQQEQSEGEPPRLDQQRAQALLEGLNEDEKEVLKQQIKQKIAVSAYKGKDW